MSLTRRAVLKALAGAGAALVVPRRVRAAGRRERAEPDPVGILYDATRCIGCRECVQGCAEEHGFDPTAALSPDAGLSTTSYAYLGRYEAGAEAVFRKVQCMHCVEAACVSACMLGAMHRDAEGAVVWDGDLCVGCRYCEIACPYNVPRFEWDSPLPKLTKCELCPERRAAGLVPACVERCRRGALVYGRRSELLAEAHRRMESRPRRYSGQVFGETEGGGTAMLYLMPAGVPFAAAGLPALSPEPVPALAETIQHTLYRGFVAPLALLGVLAAVVRRNTRRVAEAVAVEHRSEPVGGPVWTLPFGVLLAVFLVGAATILWRFASGLGATTNLNDGYAMGLWIALDVVTGTALACGGYAVALLVYVANRGRYHPLVRSALVTSALGYTLGGLSVLVDIGRGWNFYKIPLFFWEWNFSSIMLEVALCIMLYTMVLWVEVSPALLERWRESAAGPVRRLAMVVSPRLERALPYLIALGLLLPTMHQSSLGSLMLLAGAKLDPLWRTPLLPLLFLISCVAMGYAAVTLESSLSSKAFKRPKETPMLRALAGPAAIAMLLYAVVRAIDVLARGQLELVTRMDGHSMLFLLEMALFVVPGLVLLVGRKVASTGTLATLAVMVAAGGGLYRFSTYLIAFDPGPQWTYFPALPEFAVTFGLVAAEIMGYLLLVKRFPILAGVARPGPETMAAGVPAENGRRVLTRSAAATVVFLLLTVGVTGVTAQDSGADLRCLTRRPEQCLPQAVSPSEPHGAVCATCHNLWEQSELKDAGQSCATSRCHGGITSRAPFHGGLHAAVVSNCTGCHAPHDARIPGGARNCTFCHPEGGAPARVPEAAVQPPARAPVMAVAARLSFRHSTHDSIGCTTCHAQGERHQQFRLEKLADCQGCHHRPPLSNNCLNCHAADDARAITRQVTRTLNLSVGRLDNPERVLPFNHYTHDGIACETCHTSGLDRNARDASCLTCHEQHHRPTATCRSCHRAPARGAHDRQVHTGCTGTGCHDNAPASIRAVPKTREFCLGCHPEMVYHKPEKACATCHILPPPGSDAR